MSWIIELDGQSVWQMIRFSNNFRFQEWSAECIKKAHDRANRLYRGGIQVGLVKSEAFLTCSRAGKKTPLDFEDPADWEAAKEAAQGWISNGLKDVSLKIVAKYSTAGVGGRPIEGGVGDRGAQTLVNDNEPVIVSTGGGVDRDTSPSTHASDDDGAGSVGNYASDEEVNKTLQKEQREINREARRQARKEQKAIDRELLVKKRVAESELTSTGKKKTKRELERQEMHEKKKAIEHTEGKKAMELMKLWKCGYAGCAANNQAQWCWTPEGREKRHYPITTDLLQAWKHDIEERRATIHRPSLEWKHKAMAYFDAAFNKTSGKKSANGNPIAATAQTPPAPPSITFNVPSAPQYPIHSPFMYPHPYWQGQQANIGPYQYPSGDGVHSPFPQPQAGDTGVSSNSRPTTSSGAVLELASSPVRVEGDAGQVLRAYFAWQKKRHPSQEQLLNEAYLQLENEAWSLADVRGFTLSDWKELQIKPGLGKRLREEVKTFLSACTASSSPLASSPPALNAETAADVLASLGNDSRPVIE